MKNTLQNFLGASLTARRSTRCLIPRIEALEERALLNADVAPLDPQAFKPLASDGVGNVIDKPSPKQPNLPLLALCVSSSPG
jgi:hypothetical protein